MSSQMKQKHEAFVRNLRAPFLVPCRQEILEEKQGHQGTSGLDDALMAELNETYQRLFGCNYSGTRRSGSGRKGT